MVHDSRIAFCTCHLPSGTGKKQSDSRIEHIKACLDDLKKKFHYDSVFFYGDLNIRNNITQDEAAFYMDSLFQGEKEAFDHFHNSDELIPH